MKADNGGMCQRNMCQQGSFNHTLVPVWLKSELSVYALVNNLHILVIQGHWIHSEDGDTVGHFERVEGWLLLAASTSHTGVGGVDLIVSPLASVAGDWSWKRHCTQVNRDKIYQKGNPVLNSSLRSRVDQSHKGLMERYLQDSTLLWWHQ